MSKVWVQLSEVDDLLQRFLEELRKPSGDGKSKRERGEKPPWYQDDSHEAAMYSHLAKWKRGELVDPDSGCHPLGHLAWRALAIACRETGNVPEEAIPPIQIINPEYGYTRWPSEAPEKPPNGLGINEKGEPRDDPSAVLESLPEPQVCCGMDEAIGRCCEDCPDLLPEPPCCGEYFNNALRCHDCPRYR